MKDTMDEVAQGDHAELIAEFRAACTRLGVSQSEAARRADVASSTLSQWLGGKYPGNAEAVAAKIERWVRTVGEQAEQRARVIERAPFQQTPTAMRIWSMLRQAQGRPGRVAIVAIAGAPGTGKTMAARAYRDAHRPVWIVTMNPMQGRSHSVLCAIGRELGVADTRSDTIFYSVGERLRATGGLVIIDEAQHLQRTALDTVRSLFDQFEIGIALIGNQGLYAGLACAKADDDFAQFHSRVAVRRQFTGPTDEDVEIILDANRITDTAVRQFLRARASKIWGLRGVAQCIEEAALMADEAGGVIGVDHVKAAWASLS